MSSLPLVLFARQRAVRRAHIGHQVAAAECSQPAVFRPAEGAGEGGEGGGAGGPLSDWHQGPLPLPLQGTREDLVLQTYVLFMSL